MSAFLARAPRRLRLVAALAVMLALAADAAAQTETGRITGVITDATGGILPGVTVTAKAVGTGATRELVTDGAGQYVFANLPPGAYEIAANLASFRPETAKVTVTVGGAVNVDLKLQIAGTTEVLNVVAEVPVINVVNAEVATTVNQTQIRELPTLTRDVYDLVSVAGNVAYDESQRSLRELRRVAPAMPSTVCGPPARTCCSTGRRTTTSSPARRVRTSPSTRCRNSAS